MGFSLEALEDVHFVTRMPGCSPITEADERPEIDRPRPQHQPKE
jgi:hypothetical protein